MLELARRHRLVPAFDRALAKGEATFLAPPSDCAEAIRSEARQIAMRALASVRQLTAVLSTLGDAGVEALPYKGPALAQQAYGDVGVRDSLDLDVVVRPADRGRARVALSKHGYDSLEKLSPSEERILLDAYGHYLLLAPGEGIPVELHWRFSSAQFPWSPDVTDVLSRSRVGAIGTHVTPMIDPVDSVVLQAAHGTRHAWERLEWLVAMVATSRLVASDVPRLVDRARAMRALGALTTAFELARRLLGVAVTPALAADGAASALAADLERRLRDAALVPVVPARTGHHGIVLRAMDGPADRLRYLALSAVLPTMNEREAIAFPGVLAPLYYPLRLARLLSGRTAGLRRDSPGR
jgi:hypothetical protein